MNAPSISPKIAPASKRNVQAQRELQATLSEVCHRYRAIFLTNDSYRVRIACPEDMPELSQLAEALRFASGLKVDIEQWPPARIEQAMQQAGSSAEASSSAEPQAHEGLENGNETPVVTFINQTLRMAIMRRASDVHIESYENHIRIRVRIDGVLQVLPSPDFSLAASLCARLKIMGQLNVAERRLPQDGQLSVALDNQRYSMRIATLPTQHGEKIVLRILHMTQQDLSMEQLGLSTEDLKNYLNALNTPQGLILVTGPTGSGKTVTLYSGLRYLNTPERNICSVEDPIEIPVNGINQTQINIKTDLNFAKVLRALLRQDPDVIMVGEIRDSETADIAVKAAQTGHLVLSTLHTNSTIDTLSRLGQMGVEGYHIAASLRLVIAQRLVRKLCPHCRQPHQHIVGIESNGQPRQQEVWQAVGCDRCFSGYYGRVGIYEILQISTELQNALVSGSNSKQLRDIARQQHQISLFDAGMALVEQGVTSLEELYRVIGENSES